MIDWLQVLFNLFWLIGLALILAAFSYTSWLAYTRAVRTGRLLGSPTFQLPFSIGPSLVSLGLVFLGRGWLERGLWAVLAVLFAWQTWSLWRRGRP
jgi:hypothetical protein